MLLCEENEEIIEHLIPHCLNLAFLDLLLFVLDIVWVLLLLVSDSMSSWAKIFVRKADRKGCKAAMRCLMWAIWKEQNRIVFRDDSFLLSRLKSAFLYSLWS